MKSNFIYLIFKAVLPQHETNPDRIRQRKDELERKKGMYQWKVQEGWPSFIKSKFADLPVTLLLISFSLFEEKRKVD